MPVRPFKEGDQTQIAALFQKVFNKTMPEDVWEWKYQKIKEALILVYEEEGKILGHVGLWIHNVYIEGERQKIGLRIDTMVDPDERGKGIYKQLIESQTEYAKDSNISMLYGFPAEKAKELFIRYAEATHMEDVPRLALLLTPFASASNRHAIFKLFTKLDNLFVRRRLKKMKVHEAIEKTEWCDDRFDHLQETAKSTFPVKIARDKNYLNWRYFEHPEYDYNMLTFVEDGELKGYLVYCILPENEEGSVNGRIVDMDVADWENETVSKELIQAALIYMQSTNIIQAWALAHTPLYQLLRIKQFVHVDNPMPLVAKELTVDKDYIESVRSWYITQGDVDSF